MLFKQTTEQQIQIAQSQAPFGCLVTLTADAFNELLYAARAYQSMVAGSSSSGYMHQSEPATDGSMKTTVLTF